MEQPQRPSPLNILLVDDDEVDAITVKRAFAKANIECQLFVARNGIDALELLRSGVFPAERRIMLLDINMPKMNGIELLRELRADPALNKLTVIMMTTSSEENDRIDAYQLNVAGYVIKPVTFQALEKIVETLSSYWKLMQLP
jgi:CheY-like chemotaxis protein